jgi:hypothetical protein
MCQRVTGSAFSTELAFPRAAVVFKGEGHDTYSYKSTEHGRFLRFNICKSCGGRLGLAIDRFPAVHLIYAGTFDDPLVIEPAAHIFTESAVSWMVWPQHATCFARHMFRLDGTVEQPISRSMLSRIDQHEF